MNALNQPESPTMITLTLSKDAIPKSRDTKTSELIKNKQHKTEYTRNKDYNEQA